MTPTPQTDALIAAEYPADEAWLCLARRLERRAAAWAQSARNNREDSNQWMRCAGEKERVNQEQQRRIIQLICERDRLQYRAQERRALRTEIEAALGMESLPGDVEDSSLKRGLAVIAGWKQELEVSERLRTEYADDAYKLTADLARVTAERDALQSCEEQPSAQKAA